MPPISLTEKGMDALTESGFIKMFGKHGDNILEKVRNSNPATEYDVQEKSVSVVRDLCDESFINPVKDYAYEKGMNVEHVLYFGGIYARDKYFKKFGC